MATVSGANLYCIFQQAIKELLNTFYIRMPQVMMNESWIRLLFKLRDLLKSWLDCPRLTELWNICWNLDWTAPGVLDSDMSCPLVDRRLVNGSVILFEVILFTERVFVPPNIRCMNFFTVKQKAKCKQWYSSDAKFMFVSKFWKMRFLAENFL